MIGGGLSAYRLGEQLPVGGIGIRRRAVALQPILGVIFGRATQAGRGQSVEVRVVGVGQNSKLSDAALTQPTALPRNVPYPWVKFMIQDLTLISFFWHPALQPGYGPFCSVLFGLPRP